MLVNASYTPGDFFVTTVSGLCPNTDYEFAAWIMNVLNRSGIKPNVTFSIEAPNGTVLQQFFLQEIFLKRSDPPSGSNMVFTSKRL